MTQKRRMTTLCEGSDENSDYVPQSEVDDVRSSQQEMERDRPKKMGKVGAPDRSETKKNIGSATEKSGEDNPSCAEHGFSQSRARASFDPLSTQFHGTFQLYMRKRMWWSKMLTNNEFRLPADRSGCALGVYLESTRRITVNTVCNDP